MVSGLIRTSRNNPQEETIPKTILDLQMKCFLVGGIRAPESVKSSSWKLTSFNIYTACTVVVYIPSIIGQTCALYMESDNVAEMTAIAFPTIAAYLHFFISSYMLLNRKSMEQVIIRTEESFEECRRKLPLGREHNLVTDEAKKKIRMYSWIFIVTNVVTWVLWMSLPLVFRITDHMNKQNNLANNETEIDDKIHWEYVCYKMCVPRAALQHPYYNIVWAYQALLIGILLIYNTGYNSMYYALTIFAAAHFKVLASLIDDIDRYIPSPRSTNNLDESSKWFDVNNENLPQDGKSFVKEMFPNDSGFSGTGNNEDDTSLLDEYRSLNPEEITANIPQAEDYLVNCIKYHQALLGYVEDVDGVFSNLLFIFFSLNGALMCITVFQASVGSGETSSFKFLGAMITVWVPMFLICWFGELLTEQSEAVERAIYGCKWFNGSERFKKYVQFVIMRSQKAVRLSAGNFFAVSLEGFANIANTVYAYYTILMQTQGTDTSQK